MTFPKISPLSLADYIIPYYKHQTSNKHISFASCMDTFGQISHGLRLALVVNCLVWSWVSNKVLHNDHTHSKHFVKIRSNSFPNTLPTFLVSIKYFHSTFIELDRWPQFKFLLQGFRFLSGIISDRLSQPEGLSVACKTLTAKPDEDKFFQCEGHFFTGRSKHITTNSSDKRPKNKPEKLRASLFFKCWVMFIE